MASEVEIANLALSHLGDVATVSSLSPPEGSAQAEHCARFYPIARDLALEMHSWGFATKRIQLAEVTSESTSWDYAYAVPNDMIRAISVIPNDTTDDNSLPGYTGSDLQTSIINPAAIYVPCDYNLEILSDGSRVLYTDQADAVLRYIARITDTTKFTPLFTMALSWQLAALLAGPIIKGDVGRAEAKRCLEMMAVYLGQAQTSDTNQRQEQNPQVVSWIAGR